MTSKRHYPSWIYVLSLLFLHLRATTATYSLTPLLTGNVGGFTVNSDNTVVSSPYGTNQVINFGSVNGDSIDDFAVSVPKLGKVFVVYGKTGGALSNIVANSLSPFLGTVTGFVITAEAVQDNLGASISAGDIDGDGKSDLVIGAPGKYSGQGAIYVIWGAPDSALQNRDLSIVLGTGTSGFMIKGNAAGDQFGFAVSVVDVNRDGKADIIIGAPGKNGGAGAVYVIYGKSKGDYPATGMATLVSGSLDIVTTGFVIMGRATDDRFGSSVGGAGLINGDDCGDIIIGAPGYDLYRGAVYIIYGAQTFPASYANMNLATFTLNPATTGFIIKGKARPDMFGSSCGSAGKMNGDNKNEIFVVAAQGNGNKGEVYVIYGQTGTLSDKDLSTTTLDPATTGFVITGAAASQGFGCSVALAGDVNGDSKSDLIIGAKTLNTVYVVYGGLNQNIDLSSAILDPLTTGFAIQGPSSSLFGSSVSIQTGWTLNGKTGFVIGAVQTSSPSSAAYVVFPSKWCADDCNACDTVGTCTSCNLGFTVVNSVCSQCSAGQYYTGSACIACPAGCSACIADTSSAGGAICSACSSGSVTYHLSNGKCCKPECATCADSSSCSTCQSGLGFTSPGQCATCDSSQYLAAGTCSNCDSSCETCSGAGPSACLTCLNPLLLDGTSCVNSCPFATYNNNGICTSCAALDTDCTTCNSTMTCTSCFGSKLAFGSQCVASCPLATYNNYGLCTSCATLDPFCTTCNSSMTCTGCSNSKLALGSQCVAFCPPVTYNNNGVCTACTTLDPFCTACSSSLACAGCSNSKLVLGSQCVDSCPTEGFYNAGNVMCQACDSSCKACTGAGPSACTSCYTGTFLDMTLSSCVGTCPSGTYADTASGKCESCSSAMSSCVTCTSSSACTGCSGAFLLVTSTSGCVSPPCPSHTFQLAQKCESCSNSCGNCQGSALSCTSCPAGKYLDMTLATCGTTCPPGTYKSSSSWRCEACHSSCASCTGAGPSACSTCPSPTFLDASANTCGSTCPTGRYGSTISGACEACSSVMSSCSQCSSDTICTGCAFGFLYQSQCTNSCPDGTYGENGECKDCPGTCKKCTDILHCTECEADHGLLGSQCVVCPHGTYLEDGRCKGCSVGCSQCQSDSVCEACFEGFTLSDSHKCEKEKEVENSREKAAGDTFEGSSIAGAALTSGSSLPINFGLVAKIIRNLKYLNVTVSPELQTTFMSWKVNGGFLKAPKSWSLESSSKPLPGVFSRYGLDPVFLINYWKPLIMTLIGFALFTVFKVMEVTLNRGGTQQDPLKTSIPRKINLAASNFALTQIYSSLDDVMFYFVLDARSTSVDGAFRGFSLALALVLILAGSIILGFHGFLLQKYQKIKTDKTQTDSLKKFLYKYENVKLIFQDFKDITLITQSFLWVHIVRAMVSSLISATLFEYPLVQLLLLMVLNSSMIVFIAIKNPFREVLSTCSQLFCEIILFMANVCMLVMAIFDQAESYPIEAIKHLSKCIIVLNMILLFGSAIFMIFGILKDLYVAFKTRVKPPQQRGIPVNLKNNRITTAGNGEKLSASYLDSNQLQQDYTQSQSYDYEPKQNYFVSGGNTGTLYDLPNAQNQLDISDLSHGMNSRPFGGYSNVYQGRYPENNFDSNAIDESMMNTSNVDLLQSSSPMRAASLSRPRIRGRIKMPGGVVHQPRANNGFDPQSSPNIQYNNNPRPSNISDMEISKINESPPGFESPDQKRGANIYEEFVLRMTRPGMKYHNDT